MPDWSAYQKCDTCGAALGQPCLMTSGFVGVAGQVLVEAAEPHTGRKPRAEAARAGGQR